nr:FecR domain-containing protein [Acidobacteriota bacterium]
MKKAFLLFLLSLAVSLSAFAEDRHQSFLSYDDGGTVVRSGDDGREIDAHRNLPIYPGDEIITARRGRAEVRLSDGNIIGIDRTTALKVRSVLDAYEGDANETVAELRYGKVAVYRTDIGRDHVRLDTDNASYVAEREGVYSVETDSNGRDRVMVFDGSIEVRTRTRTTRLRSGESAQIDDRGVYDLAGDQSTSADDFERWFLKRAERYGRGNSRYLDSSLAY